MNLRVLFPVLFIASAITSQAFAQSVSSSGPTAIQTCAPGKHDPFAMSTAPPEAKNATMPPEFAHVQMPDAKTLPTYPPEVAIAYPTSAPTDGWKKDGGAGKGGAKSAVGMTAANCVDVLPTLPPLPPGPPYIPPSPAAKETFSPPTLPLPPSGSCMEKLISSLGGTTEARSYAAILVEGAQAEGITDPAQLAYMLATAELESDHFKTMYEYGDKAYFMKYEHRTDLGNHLPGDGYKYRGRGFVQITGRANYEKFSKILGLDLVNNPDLAADPKIAARIAAYGMKHGSFTGVGLSTYISGGKMDFYNARRIINGLNRAELVQGYAFSIFNSLKSCPLIK